MHFNILKHLPLSLLNTSSVSKKGAEALSRKNKRAFTLPKLSNADAIMVHEKVIKSKS